MNIGNHLNSSYFLQYDIKLKELSTTYTERDLGIYVTADLKLSSTVKQEATLM